MRTRIRVVVVGLGMVASRFVEELLDRDEAGAFDLTVLGAEPHGAYNRVLLTDVVAGRTSPSALALPRLDRVDRRPVSAHLGVRAVELDRAGRCVHASDGSTHPYDVLVLATGAAARVPAIPGLGASGAGTTPRGVHVLRSLDDARAIVAGTRDAATAAVIGGGVLGVEAAVGLAGRGVPTTVIHPAPALMERQLDPGSSDVLARRLAALGVRTALPAVTEEVLSRAGRVVGVRLVGGEVVPADLVVVSCGTVPEGALASAAGLTVGRGIVVGEDLASPDDPVVFAIGDCAEPPGGATGLVAQGWDQARRLAAQLAGAATSGSDPAPRAALGADSGTDVVRVKGEGIDVVTMGQSAAQAPGPHDRVIRLSDPAAGRHVEIVLRDDRVVGATCVGAGRVGADLTVAYTRSTPLPADPAHLLLRPVGPAVATTGSPTHMPGSMTVCRCNGVTKSAIVACFAKGARTLPDLAAGTRATTGCGGCTEVVSGLLDWLRTTEPDSPPALASQTASASGEHFVPPAKPESHDAETPAA